LLTHMCATCLLITCLQRTCLRARWHALAG
jgi:hypothetical protein